MKIINQSDVILWINGSRVAPGSEYDSYESAFSTLNIHSDIGSVEITTEYCQRSFMCFGKLKAYGSAELKDALGLPKIIVEYAE